jgi:WD40 repeat protein
VDQILTLPEENLLTYIPHTPNFSGVRVLAMKDCEIMNENLGVCIQGTVAHANGIDDKAAWENWIRPISRTVSPDSTHPALGKDAEVIWRHIKPGDIAINFLSPEGYEAKYNHIQVVVGWGPSAMSSLYSPDGKDTRYGVNFYPTYISIPDELGPQNFVPYVMDRYMLPNTGSTTGPRPFNFGLSTTGTDFWVATYASKEPGLFTKSKTAESLSVSRLTAQISNSNTLTYIPPSPPVNPPQNIEFSFSPRDVLAWNPRYNFIAYGGRAGLKLYTPDSQDSLTETVLSDQPLSGLSWSADGDLLASAEADKVVIWKTKTQTPVLTLRVPLSGTTDVAWNSNGSFLAVSGHAPSIRLWMKVIDNRSGTSLVDLIPLKPAIVYTGTGYIRKLAWSPATNLLAASDLNYLYIWDVSTRKLRKVIPLQNAASGVLQWTPDGKEIMTSGPHFWNVSDEDLPVLTYPGCSMGSDYFSTLSPDGRWIGVLGMNAAQTVICLDPQLRVNPSSSQSFLPTPEKIPHITAFTWNPNGEGIVFTDRNGWLYSMEFPSQTLLSVYPHFTDSLSDMDGLINQCVKNTSLFGRLTYLTDTGQYSTFLATVQAQPSQQISSECVSYLSKVAEFLMNHSIVVDKN